MTTYYWPAAGPPLEVDDDMPAAPPSGDSCLATLPK